MALVSVQEITGAAAETLLSDLSSWVPFYTELLSNARELEAKPDSCFNSKELG